METVHPLKDFRNFLFLVWKQLALPEPTKVQYDIAEYLQTSGKRSIIQAFRGVGKSYITSAYVATARSPTTSTWQLCDFVVRVGPSLPGSIFTK